VSACSVWGVVRSLPRANNSFCLSASGRLQAFDSLPSKSVRRGEDRAVFRSSPLKLGFSLEEGSSTCVIKCEVPPSMSTQRTYTTYVRLGLSEDKKHVYEKLGGYCGCQGGVAGDCTHVAAAMFTMQDLVYLAGRVPGEKSRILSCTERLQKWGVPSGDCKPGDLEITIDALYVRHGVVAAQDEEFFGWGDSDLEEEEADVPQEGKKKIKRRDSSSVQGIQKAVRGSCIGRSADMEKVSAIAQQLRETNTAQQLKLRAERDRALARKKEREQAAKGASKGAGKGKDQQ
jgi:hypothetical protein